MAVNRKGKEVVDAKAASLSSSAASTSGGKRKRPLSAAPASAASSRGGGSGGFASGQTKRSRGLSSRFIDDAAVDADDSDEFDDDDDDGDGDSGEDEDTEFMNDIQAGVKDSKGAGKSNIPLFLKEEELSGDELEEFVRERYAHGSDHVMYEEDDKECDERKSLLQSMADPTIWRVRCMVGHERHIAFCLVQKYVSLHVRGYNLPIISVFSLEHIKGYVYIEANKQHDVAEACKGFCTLYTSKIGLVPSNEVPRLLSVQNKPSEIAEGTWVRMKNGKYKGDLAQVVAVDAVKKKATVKLVPRIDLQALAKKFGGGISLKQAAIPAPRLISSHELEDFRPHIQKKLDCETGELFEILDGLMLKDGYVYKKVSLLSLNCFGVQPSNAELMKFEPAKRDEPQVSEDISHLYGGHKKNSLETVDDSLEDKGNAIKLHDLVFFGRKDFGVIIAMKCDSFQILKGGVEEPVVVSVQRKVIKNSCIDKMFTALDSHMKTICINDAIKVLEGPQQDRQGIVKHMYKGTLFVYDEENSENTGFFCVKSDSCEVMKENCHKNMGHKSDHVGSKGSVECSVPQSPTKPSDQRDYDSVKRYRQGDRDQTFTVGQTLKISVGPLKGYLCRVVRVHRSEVTVKLDSLVKLITVNCNHLYDPSIKKLGNTSISKPDENGSHERLSKGELVDGDIGEPSSKSSWNFELPSSTRVSWSGFPNWGTSSANCDDNKVCNDQGDDPWGSKVTSGDGCQAGNSDIAAEQTSQPSTIDGWSNWVKAEKPTEGEQGSWKGNSTNEGDKSGWSKAMSSNHGQADSWNRGAGASGGSDDKGDWGCHTNRPGCFQAGQGFGSNWAKATTEGWSNQEKAEKSTKDEFKNWKGDNINEGETGGWNKAASSNYGQADGWNRGAGTIGQCSGKSDWGSHNDRPGHSETGQGSGGNGGKVSTDGWSNLDKAKKPAECEHESWQGNNINECETGGWSKAMPSDRGQADSWSKGAGGGWNKTASSNYGQADGWNRGAGTIGQCSGKSDWGSHNDRPGHSETGQESGSNWGKVSTDGLSNLDKATKSTECERESCQGNNMNECETGGWSKAVPSDRGQADGWSKGAGDGGESDAKGSWGGCTNRPGHSEVGQGSCSSWDKASDWNKGEKSTEGGSGGWKGNNTNEGEIGGWGKGRASNHDQEDRWKKGAGVDRESDGRVHWGGHSDRSECFEEGQGFGCGRGSGGNRGNIGDRNQGGGFSKRLDTGEDYGSSWGRGSSRNSEAYGSGDKQDCWNRSRDSDGRHGRGRGRGFDGSGRGRNQDDGWSSGRGRGRGRRGRGVWEARGSRDDYNDCSHSGRDGNDHSFGWKNDRGSSGHGNISGDALSSWKNDQPSGWGASTAFGKNEAFDNKKDKNDSWGEKEPIIGGSSGWSRGKEGHSATRNEGVSWDRNEKLDMNQGCSNSGRESDKLGVGPDKHVDGELPSIWQREEANKWSAPEVSKNKQSSWSHAPDGDENAAGEDWSIKPKPLRADQSGGDTSASAGLQSAAWASKSAVDEKVGEYGGSGGSWDRTNQSGRKEESTWSTEKRKDWNSPEDSGNQHSVWHCSAERGAKSSAAAGDNWAKGNKLPENSESGDWHTAKAFGGFGSSDWGQKSSGGETGKDAGGGVGCWDNWKPSGHGNNWSSQESGGGNWNNPNPSSGRKQSSDWHNDEGSNGDRPKQFGGRHSSGRNNWSVGDGARRNDGRSGDWSGGKSYGGDRSSGWKGNMSSGRGNGRGRGKCFGQDQASGCSGENQEAGGADFSFSDRQESFGRSKPTSWTHDGFADKGSGSRDRHGGWSRGKALAGGQSGDANNGASVEEGWRQDAKGTWGSRDSGTGNRATGSDNRPDWNNSASTSGWASRSQGGGSNQSNAKASAWTEGATTSQDVGWEKKKCLDAAQGPDVRGSDAILSEKASGETFQGGDNLSQPKACNSDAATGWNSASASTKKAMSGEDQGWNEKVDPARGDRPGGWGNSDASFEEPRQNGMQRDAWSRENPHAAHGSGGGSGWESSKDGSAEKSGW